jgi:hypothetical protein
MQYSARADDEIDLNFGDLVIPYEHFNDGWSHGLNVSSNESGIFPLAALLPMSGNLCKFTLINYSEVGGNGLLSMFTITLTLSAVNAKRCSNSI